MAETVKNVLCYGDSNTWGYNPGTGERHQYEDRWTTVAGTVLGSGYRLIPEGLNGRTTVLEDTIEPWRNGLTYLRPCLVSHKPLDGVVIMLGTNDTKARFAVPASDIARGMRQLVRAAQTSETGPGKGGPRVGIVAPVHVGEETAFGEMFAGGHERSLALAEEYRIVAEELDVPFLDAAAHVECPFPDGIHLDADGQRTLGEVLARWIREELLD
jgi:lysophospholipase L1-like esterase